MSSLLSFPSELLLSILQWLSSPNDLYSAIEATSRFYRLFAEYKYSIMSAILQRALPSEAESDFLLAYRAQGVWKFVRERSKNGLHPKEYSGRYDSLKQECAAILEQAKSGESGSLLEMISDSETLPRLWTFYRKFEQLMDMYKKNAICALQKIPKDSEIDPRELVLSRHEQIRLQGAFFRWEVYTCLYQLSEERRPFDGGIGPNNAKPERRYAKLFLP